MVMLPTSLTSTAYGYEKDKPHVTFFDSNLLNSTDIDFSSSLLQLRTAPPPMSNTQIAYQPSANLANISEVSHNTKTSIPSSPDAGRKSRHRRSFKDLSRDLQCTEEGCERKYASKSSLSTHYRLKHSPEAKAKEVERLEAIRHKSEERRIPRPVRPRAIPSNQNLELMRHKSAGSTVGVRDLSHPFYPVAYGSLTSPANSYRTAQTPPPQMNMNYYQPPPLLFNTPSPGQQRPTSLSYPPQHPSLYNQISLPASQPSLQMATCVDTSLSGSHATSPLDPSLTGFKGTMGGTFIPDPKNYVRATPTPLEDQLLLQNTIDEFWELGLGSYGDPFLMGLNPSA